MVWGEGASICEGGCIVRYVYREWSAWMTMTKKREIENVNVH